MKIEMVDLRNQYLRIKTEIDSAIQQVIDSAAFIQGPEVALFAEELSRVVETPHVIPCANGTDALQIAFMALDLQPGDEVIVPVHTYVATAEVIALLKLKPVFVDVDPHSFTIDVEQIESRITTKTRAIVPVHLYGQCANMESVLAIADKRGLHVVEDVAQALGATYTFSNGRTRSAGTMGIIGTTSFFPTKTLGCYGDGGAIFTADQQLAERMKMISSHGQRKKYHHEIVGVNSRLDTLQAAILRAKLRHFSDDTKRRQVAAKKYDDALKSLTGLQIPTRSSSSTHVFHQYTITTDQRDGLQSFLSKKGIPTMIYYPVPLHLQRAFEQQEYGRGSFPVTEKLSQTVLSLPIHTELTDHQLGFVVDNITEFFHG